MCMSIPSWAQRWPKYGATIQQTKFVIDSWSYLHSIKLCRYLNGLLLMCANVIGSGTDVWPPTSNLSNFHLVLHFSVSLWCSFWVGANVSYWRKNKNKTGLLPLWRRPLWERHLVALRFTYAFYSLHPFSFNYFFHHFNVHIWCVVCSRYPKEIHMKHANNVVSYYC